MVHHQFPNYDTKPVQLKEIIFYSILSHLPKGKKTWEMKEKNIYMFWGSRTKKKIASSVSSLNNGNFLHVRIIFIGTTIRCLLPRTIGKVFCLIKSFHLLYFVNHWSTLEICQQFVERILIPYMKDQMQELNLPKEQKMIWLLDFIIFIN
jgi:hypothetical protein